MSDQDIEFAILSNIIRHVRATGSTEIPRTVIEHGLEQAREHRVTDVIRDMFQDAVIVKGRPNPRDKRKTATYLLIPGWDSDSLEELQQSPPLPKEEVWGRRDGEPHRHRRRGNRHE